MILHPPFEISSRLLAAVKVGGATVSLGVSDRQSRDGRDIYECYIDMADGTEHEITDMKSGCQGGSVQEGFAALFSFLGAAVESRQYRERMRKAYDEDDDSNEHLFTPEIVDWACEHSDEIEGLACGIGETPNLIEDE